MSLIHLSTELRQELKLTPQLLQSMELLQMNSQELLDYLNQVSEENPLVEQTDLSSLHKAYEALRQKVHWINGGLPEDGHGAMPDRGAADRETESLSAFLCDQLERRRLPKPLLALTRYLAELVDEEGRLSQEDLDGVADLKIPQALTQQALETLQSLDPAGVGARSLSECLLLQLARQDAPSPLDMEIVRRFLPDLGKKHYSLIARELHTTPEEVRAAEKRISALDPCPGRSFQPAEPTLYVRPDLFIAELDGKLQVILNDYYLPRVSISQYYVRLLKESDEPETRAYLQQKMQQAKWLPGQHPPPVRGGDPGDPAGLFCRPDHRAGPHDHGDTGGATPPPSLHRLPGHSGEIPPVPAGDVPPPLFLQPRSGGAGSLPADGEAAAAGADPAGRPQPPAQ